MTRAIGTLFFSSLMSALRHALLVTSVATQKPLNSDGRLGAPATSGNIIASAVMKRLTRASHRPLALHRYPRAGAGVRPVVPHRAVLGAAVVPERDRV